MNRLVFSCLALGAAACSIAQTWSCYGGNPQHNGMFFGPTQSLSQVRWQASLDDDRSYYGGEVLIHYASPMITAANTVVHGYRHTTVVNGANNYNNWSVMGRSGASGALNWQLNTDYAAPLVWPQDWTTVFPLTLCTTAVNPSVTGVAAAAAGGSIMVRSSADAASAVALRHVFYTSLKDYNLHAAAYSPVIINTPITADGVGNLFFGYIVTAGVPANLASLGTGGIACVNTITGVSQFASVESMGINSNLSGPAMNAAPALSNDGSSIYVALTGGVGMLAKLSVASLGVQASTILYDPSITGAGAGLISESSASPMVGPDGHVYMGVFGASWRESHGWMLQFDGNLSQHASDGSVLPVGAFGWDDTAVVVPANCVPSYHGTSSYLILTKYNNYDDSGADPGADGANKVGILDPGSNSVTRDRQSGIPVMNEVITILGPSLTNNDSQHPQARFEWCINSAAVDVMGKSAIINSEDGHAYRWSFVSNTITESIYLQPATGEAYTCTCIGPDGNLYAINNSILFSMGNAVLTVSRLNH